MVVTEETPSRVGKEERMEGLLGLFERNNFTFLPMWLQRGKLSRCKALHQKYFNVKYFKLIYYFQHKIEWRINFQGRSVEATPKHLIIVDGAILQPIPEHPKRDFIFCLSTAFGDAYLFQVKKIYTVLVLILKVFCLIFIDLSPCFHNKIGNYVFF